MTALAASSAPVAASAACAHCGLPVPAAQRSTDGAAQFCCSGCRQVYTLVREWGLDQYYRLASREPGLLEPAHVTGRTFDDFDDEQGQLDASDTRGSGSGRRRTRLYLEGVHCAACIWLVEKLPAVLPGVDEVRLNYGTAVADITWHPGLTRLSVIARALDRLGYTPHLHRAAKLQEARRSEDRRELARLGVAAACAMNLMFMSGALYAGEYSGMALEFTGFFRWFSLAVAVPVLVFSARPFFQTALAGLRVGTIHIDAPIALGIAVGFASSTWNVLAGHGTVWFDSLSMLVAALLGARQLQRSAQRAAVERADSLRGAAFLEFARRLDGDGPEASVVEVPLAALVPGDRVEVRSGELVPVDGVVLSGQSSLDNAVLTGEAVPQPVAEGEAVHAGATNLGARLVVRVDAAGEHTRVGALLALVQEALARRPALMQRTDAMARRFVKLLLVVAGCVGVVVGFRHGFEPALARVVALLVVACPCALGLSVPLAMSMALMRAARAGIFIKNPDALERLRHVRVVLIDKTGTLTEGKARVARWHGEARALDLAGALESESSHPVARAFQASAARSLRVVRTIEDVIESPGRGIAGRVDCRDVRVGNRRHVETDGAVIGAELSARAAEMVADGLSPVFVALDGVVAGVAGVGDRVRDDARKTVETLRARGLAVRILSGDDARIVARVAEAVGVAADDALGGLTPEDKRDIVAGLVSAPNRLGTVVMVGDGVNDAAALVLADVGVAVHGGMGATIVAADVVLTREGIAPLVEILDGARRLAGVVHRNIGFSLVYNVAASSLAAAGLIGPLAGAILMPLSSLTVVMSSAFTRSFSLGAGRAAPSSRQGQGA